MEIVWFIGLKSNPDIDCSLLWCSTRHKNAFAIFSLINVVEWVDIIFDNFFVLPSSPLYVPIKPKTSKECNNIIELVICFPIKWYAWVILPRWLYSQLWMKKKERNYHEKKCGLRKFITYLKIDKEIPDEIVSKYLHMYFSRSLNSNSIF